MRRRLQPQVVIANDCQEGGSLLAGAFFAPEKRQPSKRMGGAIGVVKEYGPLNPSSQHHEKRVGDRMTLRFEWPFSTQMNISGTTT